MKSRYSASLSCALTLAMAVLTISAVGVAPAQASGAAATAPQAQNLPQLQALQQPQDLLISDDPAGFTPHVLDGQVLAVAVVGNKVVLGGDFTQAQNASGGAVLTRNRILAFDRTTGVIDTSFVPVLDSTVRSLAPSADGLSVYVGGQFNSVSGVSASKIARISMATGTSVAGFNAGLLSALVYDVKLVGSRLFIAGQFTKVAGQGRSLLAELDPITGALRPGAGPIFAGTQNGGSSHIYKFDVNPDGQTLAAIGNFTTVGGQPRVQAVMLDIAGTPTLSEWRSVRYEPLCFSVFQYYVRDIEFSPDGEYFVISTTGGYGSGPPTLCDTASRWDADARGQAIDPQWVDYTGGDSSYAVALTGTAIYIGGHERWWNNPFASDAAGQGAVDREGIAALDPVNGLPFSWNPTRTRGRGVFDMIATTDGLWVGSDSDRIGAYEYHARIAFFPLSGGTPVPNPTPAALPVDAYVVGSAAASRYVSRVNPGGPALLAGDSGPDWAVDSSDAPSPLHNAGSNATGWSAVPAVDAAVASTTPRAVFDAERWDPGGDAEMEWGIPAAAGVNLEVRLYFANRCGCTSGVGQRIFDVSIDGTLVLDDYDIVADVGHDVGTMKAFPVTSDGNVDIDFGHVVENPLVNGIEIVDLDAPPSDDAAVARWAFDGDVPGAIEPITLDTVDWSTVRGAFALDGALYLGRSDGTFTVQSYDGSTVGPATVLDLHGLTDFQGELGQLTGLFYSEGSIFFTLFNDPNLYQRYFTVESGIVGAQRFVAGSGGVDWRSARGTFLSDAGLFWVDTATGDLHRVAFANGAAQTGTDEVVSGPDSDGRDWSGRAMFALPGEAPNQAPVATFDASCTGTTCSFDAAASNDPDGEIVDYAWDFGDDATGEGVTVAHVFDAAGTYDVTLTVTDDAGVTASSTEQVTIVASSISFVASAQHQRTGSVTVQTLTMPGGIATGDQLVLTMTLNSGAATATDPAGWVRAGSSKTSGVTSIVWTRAAPAAASGTKVSVTTSAAVKSSLLLGAYRGAVVASGGVSVAEETVSRSAHTTPTVTAPAGSWVVSAWADKSAATTSWVAPAGQQVRQTGAGSGTGHISWLLTDSGAPVAAGPAGGLTATATTASANAGMVTVVLAPTP